MGTYQTTWEDEDCNRTVHFSIDYTVDNDNVEIHNVTPRQVSFLCSQTKQPVRTVGVWTEKGRSMLTDQYHKAGHHIESIQAKILDDEVSVIAS